MGERIKAHCNECCRKTNQGILYEQSIKQEEDKIYYSSVSRYIMIQCLGCDSISFMTFEKFGIEKKQPESEWDEICHQYPEADIFDMGDFEILAEEIYGRFPAIIRDVYEEIESAVKHNALLLTGLGLRTLIEAICIQQNILVAKKKPSKMALKKLFF